MKSSGRLISVLAGLLCNLGGCGAPDPVLPPPPTIDLVQVAQEGEVLVGGFGACGFCHSLNGLPDQPLSGGRLIRDAFGEVHAPNITRAASGIGDWSEVDVMKALRANIRPDGTEILSPLHRGFEWLADADIAAVIAYLRVVPPKDNSVPRRASSILERYTTGLFQSHIEVKGYIPAIGEQFKVEYGKYLTDHVARCGSCHTKPGGLVSSEEYLAGGREISFDGESKVAPNITASATVGIGTWSESSLGDYLRSGRTPSGRSVDSRFCPVQFYAHAPMAQVEAVVAYLRTVPAVE